MASTEKQHLAQLEKLLDTQLAETKPESRVTKNGVCKLFIHQTCPYKDKCQYSHDMSKVQTCTLYAENRCKYGGSCDFSHILGTASIGKCKNIRRNGICENENCKFKHEINPCQDYEQGYCPKGPECEKAHVRKKICMNYQYGFCPNGPKCKDAHPKMLIPFDENFFKDIDPNIAIVRCYSCQWLGHKSNNCPQKFAIDIDGICQNCKKWHYKDNKCEVEDLYFLENMTYVSSMPNKLPNPQKIPFYSQSKQTDGINLNMINTTNNPKSMVKPNINQIHGHTNPTGFNASEIKAEGHTWEEHF